MVCLEVSHYRDGYLDISVVYGIIWRQQRDQERPEDVHLAARVHPTSSDVENRNPHIRWKKKICDFTLELPQLLQNAIGT